MVGIKPPFSPGELQMDISILSAVVLHLLQDCSTVLDPRLRHRWPILFVGMLFARGRRTVTSWLRAAGITTEFSLFYYALGSVGRRSQWMARVLFRFIRPRIAAEGPLVFAIDDTPTQRYGPHVQGAGLHHHPNPGPTDQKYLYGHIWVTLAWMVNHTSWGWIALPLLAKLYIRAKDIGSLPKKIGWTFRTKLTMACEMLRWVRQCCGNTAQPVYAVADGFYAKTEVIQTIQEQGMVLFSRLRRDAALRNLPGPYSGRGRPRIYGANRISLALRMSHGGGWQEVEAFQYGEVRTKTIKTFLATWRPAHGVIRVVIVREQNNSCHVFFCTDPNVDAVTILELMAGRFSIEDTFKEIKETWGAGQQQVRGVHANIGAFHSCLWSYTIVEWWSWNRAHEELTDRSDSPWDDPARRPSHGDRRRALQRHCLETELLHLQQQHPFTPEIQAVFQRWLEHALR